MKKNGFTLIEILVVMSVVLIIMVSIGGIMSGVFNSQNKGNAMDKVTQSGDWILNELKKNVLNADSSDVNGGLYFTCPLNGGTSIVITNVKDKQKTTISCLFDAATSSYKIASVSAVGTTVYLFQKDNDLTLSNCTNFVSCSTLPSLQLSNVKFNFNLGAGTSGITSETTKNFSMDVTIRN